MEIEMVIKESLQPILSMNYSHSSIVENFAAMADMMDQINDDEEAMMDDNLHLHYANSIVLANHHLQQLLQIMVIQYDLPINFRLLHLINKSNIIS